MKFSESWLREIIDLNLSSDELSHKLTMIGHELDGVSKDGLSIEGIIIAEIVDFKKHPNADRLSLCNVNIGSNKIVEVVCGAPNVQVGLKTAFAGVGQILPNKIKIKKSKIRGVTSNGMLCSASEIDLGQEDDGILELPTDAPVGEGLRAYLNLPDNILNLDLTPNRGDCFSLMGVARDLNTEPNSKLNYNFRIQNSITSKVKCKVKTPYPDICPRFASQAIENIDNRARTPIHLTEKLRKSGIRSINPVVDITNYVMLELGQPLHAYDFDKITGVISPRFAENNETLQLLDGNTIKLNRDTIVVSDESGSIGLAGIMGGNSTSVSDKTTSVFFEAAFWPPEFMAGKAREYGMQTDASLRFERGVDPAIQAFAVERATQLLLSITGGKAGPIDDIKNKKYLPQTKLIRLRQSRLNKILGKKIPKSEVERIFKKLGFIVNIKKDSWEVTAPSFRFDINIEDDLIEEIARIYGFENIERQTESITMPISPIERPDLSKDAISDHLCVRGYHEVINYSFVKKDTDNQISGKESKLELLNPISTEMAVMKSSHLAGLLQNLKRNLSRQNNRIRLFEVGNVFSGNIKNHNEVEKIAAIANGPIEEESWDSNNNDISFFNLKGDLDSLLMNNKDEDLFRYEGNKNNKIFHPSYSADIYRKDEIIGVIGMLNPILTRNTDISGDVYFFEIDYKKAFKRSPIIAKPISKYPQIRRDISIVVDSHITSSELIKAVKEIKPSTIQSVNVFDVYEGKNIEEGRKSIALGLILQEKSRTLRDKEADDIISMTLKSLQSKYSAKLRD